MKMQKRNILSPILFSEVLFIYSASAQQMPQEATAIANLRKDIPQLLAKADVPGMSIGLIRNGKVVWIGEFGIANAKTKSKVNRSTVFEAASLSKPVFAYAILKLVNEGKLIKMLDL
jgi:CubicO group peptidase (beta-lactamase class C family)